MFNNMSNSSASPTVVIISGSIRTGSMNQALAREIQRQSSADGDDAHVIDLADYPMPLYNGDIQLHEGIPGTANALLEVIAAADVVVFVSPEYNGSFTPLIKNTIDWISRIDMKFLQPKQVLLASATPGPTGGQRGLKHFADWMRNIDVTVADDMLTVAKASLAGDGTVDGLDPDRLAAFTAQIKR